MIPWCDGLDGLCIVGILRFEKKAAVSLGHGQGLKAEFTIKEGKTGGATADVFMNCVTVFTQLLSLHSDSI